MRLILSVATIVALSACSPAENPSPASTEETTAPAVLATLGDVDLNQPLRALGTEPFWGVEITGDALVYSGVDRPEQRAANPGPVVQGTTAVFTAMTDQGAALVVTLIDTECSDGMSDRTYPLTARVELGTETLEGCAISRAELDSLPPA